MKPFDKSMLRFLSIFLALILIKQSVGIVTVAAQQPASTCGVWEVKIVGADPRISVETITSSGKDCRGSFKLSNKTGLWGFGGYTFELTPRTSNTNANWQPVAQSDGKNYLVPGLDVEIDATPFDPEKPAEVSMWGSMTGVSVFTIDLSFFLMRTILALVPGPGCLISEDQILLASLRGANILQNAASLTLKGDLAGARDEIVQVRGEFFKQASEELKGAGVGCSIDLVQSILMKPLAGVKIGVAEITWVGPYLFDYWKYQGSDVGILISYNPAIISTPTFTPTVETIPPLDRTDRDSVLRWLAKAIATKDLSIFEKLAIGDVDYVNYIEGGQGGVSRQKFLDDLTNRLPSGPRCDSYAVDPGTKTLQVWTSGWEPSWEMTEMCYVGCQAISPPYQSNIAAFFLRQQGSEWTIQTIWLNNQQIWKDVYQLTFTSCDTLLAPTFGSETPSPNATAFTCSGTQPTRLKVGSYASVSVNPPLANRVRSGPGKSNSIVDLIQPGKGMEILGGPICADGWVWWHIRTFDASIEGWTAEGDAQSYWLVPCSSRNNCGTQ